MKYESFKKSTKCAGARMTPWLTPVATFYTPVRKKLKHCGGCRAALPVGRAEIPEDVFIHAASAAWCFHGISAHVLGEWFTYPVAVDHKQKTRSGSGLQKRPKDPKLSVTQTGRALWCIENLCQ
ncbi:uncharacterized protein LOC119399437 [Rhipicephalus sanguineus]|uniref:uncharacterized protein LOC119399437 n=1 Tax=Rhipicephalus sanguineus TaxID=34632 RepID=UPI001894D1AA|nr:uncharacterized protein LOC119399437 [Rhipicephalus sanguineus]